MALLSTHGLTAHYGDFQALYGVDIRLDEGSTVAVIGANGAGKSTFMKAVTGLLPSKAPMVMLEGQPIGDLPAHAIMKRGIALVPEGRKLFPSLSVEENLLIGAQARKTSGPWTLETIYDLFPILKERHRQAPTTMSGGQQQMAAIGRALMSNPKVLLCDEISLGLAPVIIRDIYAALPRIRAGGTAVLIVEQDITQALAVADHVYCVMEGRVTLQGKPAELTTEAIRSAYFGMEEVH